MLESLIQSKGITSQLMSAEALPLGLRQHLVVDQPRRRCGPASALTCRRFDGITRPAELCGDVLRRDGGHVGVFPGVAGDLHAGVRDALSAFGIRGDLVADQKERRLSVVVLEDLQQPVGVGTGTVVERQRHALDLCAVHVAWTLPLGRAR